MDKHKTINREQKFKKESQSSLERDSTVIFSLFQDHPAVPGIFGKTFCTETKLDCYTGNRFQGR